MEVNGRAIDTKNGHTLSITNVPSGQLELKLHGCDHGHQPKLTADVAAGGDVYVSISGSIGSIHGIEHLSQKDKTWWDEKADHKKSLPQVDWNTAAAYVHKEKEHHHHHHEHKKE